MLPANSFLGLSWIDIQTWMRDVRFARPELVWLCLALPVWTIVNQLLKRHKSQLMQAFAGSRYRPMRGSWIARYCFAFGCLMAIIAVAGPAWGKSDETGVAVGRDVIVVIDLSRSMLATDLTSAKSRGQAAIDAASDLVRQAQIRGGHRVGIVIFAARAKVYVPLTTDYSHLLTMLKELDVTSPPLEVRPDESSISGTRIGAGVRLATEAHDQRYPGMQDIILLSDGDDPGDDDEYKTGIHAARIANVPVHVVAIGGNEVFPLIIPNPKVGDDELIATRVNPTILEPIARDTGGKYIPAYRESPNLGEFFRTQLEPLPSRELLDDSIRIRKDRSAWCYAICIVLLMTGYCRSRGAI